MRPPRFRLLTLMIAVIVTGLLIGSAVEGERMLKRTRYYRYWARMHELTEGRLPEVGADRGRNRPMHGPAAVRARWQRSGFSAADTVIICVLGLGAVEPLPRQSAGLDEIQLEAAASRNDPQAHDRQVPERFMVRYRGCSLLGPDGEERERLESITNGAGAISPDGRWAAFSSSEPNPPPGKRLGRLVIQSRARPTDRTTVPLVWGTTGSSFLPLWSSDSQANPDLRAGIQRRRSSGVGVQGVRPGLEELDETPSPGRMVAERLVGGWQTCLDESSSREREHPSRVGPHRRHRQTPNSSPRIKKWPMVPDCRPITGGFCARSVPVLPRMRASHEAVCDRPGHEETNGDRQTRPYPRLLLVVRRIEGRLHLADAAQAAS